MHITIVVQDTIFGNGSTSVSPRVVAGTERDFAADREYGLSGVCGVQPHDGAWRVRVQGVTGGVMGVLYFLFHLLFYIMYSLFCMKVGSKPLKGILLSAMMGFFYLLFFKQLSLDSFLFLL